MAVLGRALQAALIAGLGGCYSPDLPECAVACGNDTDCGPGQVCGSDRLCASPGRAETCAEPDGDPVDAKLAPRDAAPEPDAAPLYKLVVKVEGNGKLEVEGHGTCRAECEYQVVAGPQTLRATPDLGWRIEKWEDGCDGSTGATCWVVVTKDVVARVKFHLL